jgi:hypothetical protein
MSHNPGPKLRQERHRAGRKESGDLMKEYAAPTGLIFLGFGSAKIPLLTKLTHETLPAFV